MSRRQPAEESLLFDLPLDRTPTAEPEPAAVAETGQPPLPLARPVAPGGEEEAPGGSRIDATPERDSPDGGATKAAERAAPGSAATLRLRLIGGAIDLAVLSAVLVILIVLLLTEGLRPSLADWPGGASFLLTFSFLYSVLPLAFWGRTPGMALADLRVSSADGRPLTFRQAALSWLGAVLTVALAGLPLLLALGGRSLSERVSGSITRRSPRS